MDNAVQVRLRAVVFYRVADVVGQSRCIGHAKVVVHLGLAQIAINKQHPLVCLGNGDGQVDGGRRFALTALVVVGDGKGRVGIGMGKSQEVPTAIKKGVEDAKKNMFSIPLTEAGTLPHDIIGEYGAGRVLLKPATPGTGVIAGGAARAVLELAGVKDVFAKSLGTDNVLNIVKAVAEGLKEMQSPEAVSARRGISVAKIYGWKEN